ncbi:MULTISPECIES: type III restriction-modification system endonuclease [Burkholderia]|uniref:type III restriction-modification system endonuclease n=1 Tax=Burkholderia TaxID=32008 RepID=UPI0008414D63|nr:MULTISPECIES: DEAD/DEAH box helicase family protein [unclassified Burkholderia]AOK28281.1 restriction endonuclease subunit R [Burkholderia sp. Bp7605]
MQLHFESDLDYQLEAVEAVCGLFRGQQVCDAAFSVTAAPRAPRRATPQMSLGMTESALGVGNRLMLDARALAENLAHVQARNGLPPSGTPRSNDFTVEMETGTGKTYVYLRTIFELHRRYDFTKFVIVVPSVAIKEGVHKTLEMTERHFSGLYAGVPFDYFVYDSTRLGDVRGFASKSTVQIMIVTVAAINKKDVNVLYKESEKTGGEKPIDLIRATRPIVIVDEPQSVDGGLEGRGKEALDAMQPLCTLRYSATHADKYQMVYRLDAIDAYERRLVKQIEIASASVEDAHNKPFVRVLSISNRRGAITARAELDVATPDGGVRRQTLTLVDGDDLERVAKRAVYANFRIGEIHAARGAEYLELRYPGGTAFLSVGDAYGDVQALAIQREMIRRTIREHLDKELRLKPLGVKVLSLFFVDSVANYRKYDANGQPEKGDYALIFEDEYRRAAHMPAYRSLFDGIDPASAAEAVHDGYFSIDKKGGWTDTNDKTASSRENAERAYGLIMKDKERLLSFDTPLKFIFSHSALKEGWDNPNVFQICTLRDIHSERERRQTIGRGLRLAVNQRGERVRGFGINTLTVIAGESYEQFAEHLQKEIEADTGIRFGIVDVNQFAALPVVAEDGSVQPLGSERSNALWTYLAGAGYLDARGRVQDTLRAALKLRALPLPDAFDAQRTLIVDMLRKLAGRLDVRNADERRDIALRRDQNGKAVYLSDAFRALWARIQYRTAYRVNFDNARLIERCVAALRAAPAVARARLQWRKADIAIEAAGIEAIETENAGAILIDEGDIALPDLLTELQDRTQLTRRTIATVLIESGRLDEFPRNPQRFIELVADTLERCKRDALVDGIEYKLLGERHVHALSLFEDEPLTGYLKDLRCEAAKSIHADVRCDSAAEFAFVDALERDAAVELYAKLPGWFKIPTPLGNYHPDWAVVTAGGDGEASRLYFVVDTKGGLADGDLHTNERRKIQCAAVHFRALEQAGNPVRYLRARTVDDLWSATTDERDVS